MNKIFKLAEEFKLKLHKQKQSDDKVKSLLEDAFKENEGEDVVYLIEK